MIYLTRDSWISNIFISLLLVRKKYFNCSGWRESWVGSERLPAIAVAVCMCLVETVLPWNTICLACWLICPVIDLSFKWNSHYSCTQMLTYENLFQVCWLVQCLCLWYISMTLIVLFVHLSYELWIQKLSIETQGDSEIGLSADVFRSAWQSPDSKLEVSTLFYQDLPLVLSLSGWGKDMFFCLVSGLCV